MLKRIAAASLAAISTALMFAGSANAAGQDGNVENGEFVFWYNSNGAGSLGDVANPKPDLSCCTFITSGNGQGLAIKNRAAYVRNNWRADARVYYNSGYVGVSDFVPAYYQLNLTNTKNDNASFKWLS